MKKPFLGATRQPHCSVLRSWLDSTIRAAVPLLLIVLSATALDAQSISITNPAANQAVSGFSGEFFQVSFSSAPSVVKVCYTVDAYPAYHPGIDASTTLGCSTTPPFNYDFNSYWYLNGPHQLVATAYDALGNVVATSSAVQFSISNPWPIAWSPSMTITTSTPLTSNWSGAVTVTDTVSGSGAGTDSLVHSYYIDGILQGTLSGTAATQAETLYTTQFPNGTHVIAVKVSDSSQSAIVPNGETMTGIAAGQWTGAATEWSRTVTFANGAAPMAALVSASSSCREGTGGHEIFMEPGDTCQLSAVILNTDGSTTAATPVCQAINPTYGVFIQGPAEVATGLSISTPNAATVSSSCLITATAGTTSGMTLINVMVPTTTMPDLTATSPFGHLTSTSHPFTLASAGNLVNITGGTNWTPGIYQITSVGSSGSAVPIGSPANPGNTSTAATATTGPTRQVWVYVNPGNASPAPCYGGDGSIQTSWTTNCRWMSSMFNSFAAMQNDQPYGAGLASPLTAPGAGWAATVGGSGINTLELAPLPPGVSFTGSEMQSNFQTDLTNYINNVVEGVNGIPANSKFKGLTVGGGSVLGCPNQTWGAAYGNESTWTPQTGLQSFISSYMATGNVLGMTTIDEISGNCGFTPLQGPITFSSNGTTQSAMTAILANSGVCTVVLNGTTPFSTLADGKFIITGSVTSGMNSVAPAVYSTGDSPSGASISATATGSGGLTITINSGGTNYWVAPVISFTGGSGSYTSTSATVSGGAITSVTVTGASGYWSNPQVNIYTGNFFNFACPSVANGTYNASNDSGLTLEPYGDTWFASNTSWMKYDSWEKIWNQINGVSNRKFFFQNPSLGDSPPIVFANWGGNANYPGAQSVGSVTSVADAGDLYVPYGPGNYLMSRLPLNGLLNPLMYTSLRFKHGAYNPNTPFTFLTEATTSYEGQQGYNISLTGCSGNTCTFSSPHGITNIVPGITRIAISSATDNSGATDTANQDFVVLAAPTPTTLTVLLGSTNFSGSGSGGTATTQDSTNINLSTISAAGTPQRGVGNSTVGSSANTAGFLAGDPMVPSSWVSTGSGAYPRKRGQTFTLSGVSGTTTPTSKCIISANCSWTGDTFMILPENLNLATAPTTPDLYYRVVPRLNSTGGTASILTDFNYHHGINGSNPTTDTNPEFSFGSCAEAVLQGAAGQRIYKIMTHLNAYSDQYGFMSSGTVGNISWLDQFPDSTNTSVSTQIYVNPHFEESFSVPAFWALSNCGLYAQYLTNQGLLLQPALNSPDCGMFVECAARSGSKGDLLMAFNATDGVEMPTFNLAPYLQPGQQIIRQVVNARGIQPLTLLAAGTLTDNPTLQPGEMVFYQFPAAFAGTLNQPTVGFRLADGGPNTVSATANCGYDVYNLANTKPVNLGSGTAGLVSAMLPFDKNVGPVYCMFSYLGSSNQVLAGGLKSALTTF